MARLRLVQVLHRHGDRSPLHNVYGTASTLASREDALWKSKLQEPTSGRGIYGELTRHGVAQMERRGDALHGHLLAWGWTMDKLDLQVFSTHYVRTQRSVQALLSQFAPGESPSIEILPKHNDFINAYNTHGPMISAVKDSFVSTHPPVVEREAAMAPIKAELMRLLPMYSTERFTWMNAADYFVCRQAHGLDYITHTEPFAKETIDHLAFRFHHFYSNLPILRHVAATLADRVISEMQQTIESDDGVERVRIYSGHDVSVLALLYATENIMDSSFWPDYSAAMTIELYQGDDDGKWIVETTLDGHSLGRIDVDSFCQALHEKLSD
ncbi:unnamed protein product [Aphanomyces euteiches]